MAWNPISGTVPQYEAAGVAASGHYLKFYGAGTTTAIVMSTDSTGGTTLAKSQLNSEGYPLNGSSAIFIPHIAQSYKIVLYANETDADANTFGNAVWNVDNLSVVDGGNSSSYELGTQAAAASHVGISPGFVIKTDYVNSNRISGSGSEAAFTGTTTVGKAGNWPDAANGLFHDADGKAFQNMGVNGEADPKQAGAVADGTTDDLTAVNSTISGLNGLGLIFTDGDYAISADTTALPANTTVRCVGGASLSKSSGASGTNIIFFTAEDYCRFEDIFIDAGESTTFTTHSFGIYGLLASATVGVEISGCKIINCGTPIRVDGALDWDIHDNYISTCKSGVLCFGSISLPLKRINVHHNLISTCDDPAIAFVQSENGGIVERCSGNDNLIFDTNRVTSGYALDLEAADAAGKQRFVEFSNNIILQGAFLGGGITIGNFSDGCIVSDNIVIGGYTDQNFGINVPRTIDCSVTGNHVETFNGDGINLTASTNAHISDNTIVDCGSTSGTYVGIRMVLASGTQASATLYPTIENNTLKNTIGGVAIGDTGGINAASAAIAGNKGYVIRGNTFINFTTVITIDIPAVTGKEVIIDDISGNVFRNCTSTNGTIRLQYCQDGVVHSNVFIDCKEGIIGDNCTDLQIYSNRIRDNGAAVLTDYINMTTMTDCDLYDNHFSDTTSATVTFTGTGARIWNNQGFLSKTFITLANDATPTVANWDLFLTGGTTTITDFDDGEPGQEIEIHSEHAVTITDGTNIFLVGSANFVMASTDVLKVRQKADGLWYEVTRSVN